MNSSETLQPAAIPSTSATDAVSVSRRAVRILAATLVVALAAHVAFPLPFTPVPFTLQPLAVLGVGLFLGPIDGLLAMLTYLAEGAAGLPVFSPTGLGGLAQLLGPTGGYLLAYPLVAFLTGCSRKLVPAFGAFTAALFGCVLATGVLFALGATWLAHVAHLGSQAVWLAAIAPFLPGEVVKCVAAAGIFRAIYLSPRAR